MRQHLNWFLTSGEAGKAKPFQLAPLKNPNKRAASLDRKNVKLAGKFWRENEEASRKGSLFCLDLDYG
ncbi:MAG: hypothetical protein RJQ00_10750 [Vicingaceae bacterium]